MTAHLDLVPTLVQMARGGASFADYDDFAAKYEAHVDAEWGTSDLNRSLTHPDHSHPSDPHFPPPPPWRIAVATVKERGWLRRASSASGAIGGMSLHVPDRDRFAAAIEQLASAEVAVAAAAQPGTTREEMLEEVSEPYAFALTPLYDMFDANGDMNEPIDLHTSYGDETSLNDTRGMVTRVLVGRMGFKVEVPLGDSPYDLRVISSLVAGDQNAKEVASLATTGAPAPISASESMQAQALASGVSPASMMLDDDDDE